METKDKLDKYDELINAAMINLWMISNKAKEELYFKNINRHDKAHLALINIINNTHVIWGINVKINARLFEFLWIKHKLKAKEWLQRTKENDGIDAYDFIKYLETGFDAKGYFADLYDEYYAKGN